MTLLKKENKSIEKQGFVYFTKMNRNIEKLNSKFDEKIEHLFQAFREMHENVQSLNIDSDNLKKDYKQIRVIFLYQISLLIKPNPQLFIISFIIWPFESLSMILYFDINIF